MSRGPATALPPLSAVRRRGTHRLIPAKYSSPSDPLEDLADTGADLQHLVDLSNATQELSLAMHEQLPAIGAHELSPPGPHAHVINAAFVYAHPAGSRFNNADRGAWYAAFQLPTAEAEVTFHKTVHLAEVGIFADEVEFDDYITDFNGDFHDLRGAKRFAPCLDPSSYIASQTLAERLLESGSLGVVYPSVRRARGTCLACFDPKRVLNVRRGERLRFTWSGKPSPRVMRVGSRNAS